MARCTYLANASRQGKNIMEYCLILENCARAGAVPLGRDHFEYIPNYHKQV